ncbi:thioester-containing protein 1 allele R1-like [Musca autumnalis]|uniref:thioester-containing protein 1 allele R1-like n=1 Tax=Musca autumnalis TaxID=221902 RepID=UPI003CFAB780
MQENIVKKNNEGFYTIVAPGSIQPDTDYTVTVTLHQNSGPVTIQLAITGISYNQSETIEIQPLSSAIVNFKIPPQLKDDQYILHAEGTKGLIFKESAKLFYKCAHPCVHLQMDKATYKPGDTVQYRIIALDRKLKPAKLFEPLNLIIQDRENHKLREVKNIPFHNGVHHGRFQLSHQTRYGQWIISITEGHGNKVKTQKPFRVAKYNPPEFTIEIESDEEVPILDRITNLTIYSKYPNGDFVKGIVKLNAKLMDDDKVLSSAEKIMETDGILSLEFNFMEELDFEQYYKEVNCLQINFNINITDSFSGMQGNTSTKAYFIMQRYTLTLLDMPQEYEVNETFEVSAVVKHITGRPITNVKSPMKLILIEDCKNPQGTEVVAESEINSHGVAVFKLHLTQNIEYNFVKLLFEEQISKHHIILRPKGREEYQDASDLSSSEEEVEEEEEVVDGSVSNPVVSIAWNDFKIGDEVPIDIRTSKSDFAYLIMANGVILYHEFVHLKEKEKRYVVKIPVTFDMLPYAKIFAYFIGDNGEIYHSSEFISLKTSFQQKLEISAPEEIKTGEDLTLKIQTDPESFVGLMAVDQRVFSKTKKSRSVYDFNYTNIFDALCNYESETLKENENIIRPGEMDGFLTLTNAKIPQPKRVFRFPKHRRNWPVPSESDDDKTSCEENRIEEYATLNEELPAETWIFEDIESTDSNGLATFTKQIPEDSASSWVITGFSLNPQTGFCLTQKPTKVHVFKPISLHTSLPYSIKLGEVIAIPIKIWNNMEEDFETEISLEILDNEYKLMEETLDADKLIKKVCVASMTKETIMFRVKPKVVGEIMLKIKASTSLFEETIHRNLKVESDVATQYKNEAHLLNIGSNENSVEDTFKAMIPNNIVMDSQHLELMVVGDILAPIMENIDQLLSTPIACGEENMHTFVTNLSLLEYLNADDSNTSSSMVEKLKNSLELGYQQQITYKHKNGSYSQFGRGRSKSNTCLTAYVARSMLQARQYISIDEKIIDDAFDYLVQMQKDNGQFAITGGSIHNELVVTAFILHAFLEDQDTALKYKKEIDAAIQYLSEIVVNEDDPYSLAHIFMVFQKIKHPQTENIKQKLQLKAKCENNLKWWSCNDSQKYPSNDIEMTSYILQSLLETEELEQLLPIIKWLVVQRNHLGGYDSARDTSVGLKVLVKCFKKYAALNDGGKVEIQFKGFVENDIETTSGLFHVDKDNFATLQKHLLPSSTKQIQFDAIGQGTSLIQLFYHYNINTACNYESSFIIQPQVKATQFPGQLLVNLGVEYKPLSEEIKYCNMVIIEMVLPSGFTLANDKIRQMRKAAGAKRIETKNHGTLVIIYFEELCAKEAKSFDLILYKSHQVDNVKISPITIYDYYNVHDRTTVYYSTNI